MRYYWCCQCGFVGDFGFDRERRVLCQDCSDDLLAEITEEEYNNEKQCKKVIRYAEFNRKRKESAS